MAQEFLVKFETKLPVEKQKEIELAIREAVFATMAKSDLSRGINISDDLADLRELIGGGHTAGMLIR